MACLAMVTLRYATGAVANPLSFTRTAMRELVRGRWRIEKARIDLDEEGRGEILYRLFGNGWTFHFFLVSTKLPEEQKLDRNFALSWDAMGVLCQGEWTPEREAYLRREVPKQRAGRADYDTLVYARGNRSGRLFDHVVESLAAGHQPDAERLAKVGYVLRTTAFIANGQLGTRPFAGFEADHPMRRPYHAQMWSAFLLREYVFDLIDHLARMRNPRAASLHPALRRYLGLGNSAATGLVPFIVNHPLLIHSWMQAYENARDEARARTVQLDGPVSQEFERLLAKAVQYFREGSPEPDVAFSTAQNVAEELANVQVLFEEFRTHGTVAGARTTTPWQMIYDSLARSSAADAVEVFSAILLELYPDIVDRYADMDLVDERLLVDPAMTVAQLRSIVLDRYSWAIGGEIGPNEATYFWYRSTQAPRDLRRGLRGLVTEFEAETPMDVALRVRELNQRMGGYRPSQHVAELLCAHPELRHIVARVQSLAKIDHGELQANFLAKDFSPFAPIRFVLAFKGMEKFEAAPPKSVRGAFLQGAPIAEDVERGVDGVWPFPLAPKEEDFHGTLLASAPRSTPAPPLASTTGRAGKKGLFGSDSVTVAPFELLRLLHGSLQGGGLELGVAEEAADMVLFVEGLEGGAVTSLLRQLDQGGMCLQAGTQRRGDRIWLQDAVGLSALAVASNAVDMACAQALASKKGLGASLVLRADQPDAIIEISRRCAERGLLGLLLWQDEQAGIMLAGPGEPEPWLIKAAVRAPVSLYKQLASAAGTAGASSATELADATLDKLAAEIKIGACSPSAIIDKLTRTLFPAPAQWTMARDTQVSLPVPGFLLLCLDLAAADAGSDFFGYFQTWTKIMLESGMLSTARIWTPEQVQRQRKSWHSNGFVVPTTEFEALTKAAARIFVPAAEEHRLRPNEGTDPLKVF